MYDYETDPYSNEHPTHPVTGLLTAYSVASTSAGSQGTWGDGEATVVAGTQVGALICYAPPGHDETTMVYAPNRPYSHRTDDTAPNATHAEHIVCDAFRLVIERSTETASFYAAQLRAPTQFDLLDPEAFVVMYATWAACLDCAKDIQAAGVKHLVRHTPPSDAPHAFPSRQGRDDYSRSILEGTEYLLDHHISVTDFPLALPGAHPILFADQVYVPGGAGEGK